MEPERLRPERTELAGSVRVSAPEAPGDRVQRPESRGSSQSSDAGASGASSSTARKPDLHRSYLKIFAVVVLAVLGWLYFGHSSHSSYLTAEEASPNYQKNKNANPSVPAVLTARDMDRAKTQAVQAAAVTGNPLPGITNPSPAFIEAAKRGDVTFYAVRVYDSCAEDGDVVSLDLPMGGEIGPIPLTIAGTTVSIPVVAGQPAQVRIVGVKDGVGGITLGAESSGGTWFSEVLDVGGSENMQLSVQ